MEVTDESSNTGEIMSIESRGCRASLYWNGGMGLRTNREAPELGTSCLLSTMEYDRVILKKR